MIFRFIRSSLAWPPNRRSISRSLKNSHSNTCWVSFPRFFGVENPNLRSDWCLDVHWGHWRRPMTSLDLQNGGHFRIRPLTHVGCLFLDFFCGGESLFNRFLHAKIFYVSDCIMSFSIEPQFSSTPRWIISWNIKMYNI